jgi:hypothetical protein
MWIVFLKDHTEGVTRTIGEFLAESPADAVEQAQERHGYRDWLEYWTVPSEWFKENCLDMLLEGALH